MTLRQWSLILLTAALFGSSFLFIKVAVAHLPPMTIAAGRAFVAALVIGAVARRLGVGMPPPGPGWRPLAVVGLLTAIIPYAFIAAGQTRIDSSLGGILFASVPLFSVFLSRAFLPDEPLTPERVAGALIGLGGVGAVIGRPALAGLTDQLVGAGATLIAAASYAAGAVYARAQIQWSPLVIATGQVIVAAPALILIAAINDAPWSLDPSPAPLVALVAVGVVSTAIPVILLFRLVREIGATRASVLTFFIPVFAAILGTLILGERPSAFAYSGLVLILTGAILISREPKP